MSYVDLNPIRAAIAKTPEKSDYTAVQQRIKTIKNPQAKPTIPLMRLSSSSHQKSTQAIAFSQSDYLNLVDWLGRAILPNKRGFIDNDIPPIIERLNLQCDEFIQLMQRKDDLSQLRVIGSPSALTHYLANAEQKFIKGSGLCERLFI